MFMGPGHSVHVNFRKETKAGLEQVAFPGSRVSPQTCRSAACPWRTVSQWPTARSYPTLASLATEVGIQQSLPKLQCLSTNFRVGVSLQRVSAGEMLEKGEAELVVNGSITGQLGTQVPFSYKGEGIAYTLRTESC